jgi:glycosyltransferase involved in cell wall biosynthesis
MSSSGPGHDRARAAGGRDVSVCALVPYPLGTTPSQRFRIEQWASHLAEQGIRVEVWPFADDRLMRILYGPGRILEKGLRTLRASVRRLAQLVATRRYDVVVVHRGAMLAGPPIGERFLKLLGRPLIYDFDDAIFLLDSSPANQLFAWLKFPGKTATLCRLSDRVVVANATLADYARGFNDCVSVVPSSVDTERFHPAEEIRRDHPLVLGWTGSATSQRYLEAFAEVLQEIQKRRPVTLVVHSDRRPVLPSVRFSWSPWSAESEADELRRFDIGIMPMPDDAWTRGKSAMKALLCMATGVPVVCSAVGTNREVVQHGANGLLAATPAEWLACLEALIDDAALRERLGRAGRARVEARYSARICAGQFAAVIRAALPR